MPKLKKFQMRKKKPKYYIWVILILSLLSGFIVWYLPIIIGIFIWLVHEAYLSDHIFYNPCQNYCYNLTGDKFNTAIKNNQLVIEPNITNTLNHTVLWQITIKSSLLCCLFDPYIKLGNERQYFEKGARGIRFVNLSGQNMQNLTIKTCFCQISQTGNLHVMANPDFTNSHIMIIAPHADDAEIAAFGLYSKHSDVSIITISQGEVEADFYQQRFNLPQHKASRLKGLLRSFDSVSAGIWGKVKAQNCVQLGYFCSRLKDMRTNPDQSFTSLAAQIDNVKEARRFNSLELPTDGKCNWHNLIADLTYLIKHFKPDVIVSPHPEFDSHPDHIAATYAMVEAVQKSKITPKFYLLYTNHLHNHDLLPLGNQNFGNPLPPAFTKRPVEHIYSTVLDDNNKISKTLSLSLMHDLRPKVKLKLIIRRVIQMLFAKRSWNEISKDEYLRKANCTHEIFWLTKKIDK